MSIFDPTKLEHGLRPASSYKIPGIARHNTAPEIAFPHPIGDI
ncbi:hypothetical protein EYZ11_012561 [Aspergillus tanneri]|uniref:Uncharacterized protein n=1 Tax=Aspergillus tanneri TaxID=1220188 RepID=A0A4V3UMN6_9EURO|nr:hypothetical protein EYZ11_012561 [Aspergillus tanneri]